MEENSIKSKSILVPTDFSETCDKALSQAIDLAKETQSKVIALHVCNVVDNPDTNEILQNMLKDTSISKHKHEAIQRLIDISKTDEGLVETIIREGDIFHTISEIADEKDIDMIVLGTHGKKGMQKVMGSYALKVIDSTTKPVVVIQDNSNSSTFKNIVFPVNVHEDDRQKAEAAVQMFRQFGSKIHVFVKDESLLEYKKKREKIVHQLKEYFNKYEVDYKIIHHDDSVGGFEKQVIAYSKFIHADLIMIVSNPSMHLPVGGGKEESLIFNKLNIPIMCVNARKYKSGVVSPFSFGGF
jgi:nucleotide-binding universal stress UspA family protein